MPYIKADARSFAYDHPATLGELNYFITTHILSYMERGNVQSSYSDYNAIVGVIECVKLEFYRRMVASYEDQKLRENGDVFPNV